MKKTFYLYILIITAVSIASCKKGFLDQVPDDRLTTDDIFESQNTTLDFLANVYSYIPDEGNQRFVTSGGAGPWTAASDEAKYTWDFVNSNNINLGSWNATSGFVGSFWQRYYRGIRNASYFMNNVAKCVELGPQLIKQYGAEARALRAIYYFYLIRMYGPVPITGENPISPDASFDDVQLARNTFDEVVSYITTELDKSVNDLPVKTQGDNKGRIDQATAHIYKMQTLLLAASPLFNGNPDYASLKNADGKALMPAQYDANKWKLAADAAKAFIDKYVPSQFSLFTDKDAAGKVSPYLSCRNVMLNDWNDEWIFGRPSASIGTIQYDRTPYHAGAANEVKGGGGLGATQNMVNAFFMANGQSPFNDDGTINPNSGYLATGFSSFKAPYDAQARQTHNMWVNREPRFYVSITYDNSVWLNTNTGTILTTVQYSGNSGVKNTGSDHSPTGYIVRKNVALGNWSNGNRALVFYRLAQVFLDYAEALNESEPGNTRALYYLNLIRERAGVPQYGVGADPLPIPADQAATRLAIRKERRVELAFENVRYFDTRRWKVADQTDKGPIYGLNINADGTGFYNVVPFETRVFEKKHYLFPIPQGEIDVDKKLVQNTGWE
ncbi:RagB/SusD family nutrient uptake outer membrane protein [Paraflavitalea sp. CAU 1676]|uniref:RagB/SusD family nutrient uptake outer membrane protein n=1 Tax=Paraflavitalea sp. CAU 1676 TaxID=3032598 RepID=UPI0023D9B4C6|nr:RagB/SusD family nutrient uptake outer membrane protein [Paraflavitalea sp. CAU 1676]MDF2190720.1 RagB/SusD family nutrient uptake outer membrane protein [Paraflavitalea sp. CAU 1676]